MSPEEAAAIRQKWSLRKDKPVCVHGNLEMIWTATGTPTDKYVCMICGKEIICRP
jgi:hypothetical protein